MICGLVGTYETHLERIHNILGHAPGAAQYAALNALMTNKCPDPVFKGELDRQCLLTVHSREHWWQHLFYAMGHVKPEKPAPVGRR